MSFSCMICGLVLSCICFRGSHEEVFVDQSPPNITVKEGESAQISCCWNKTDKYLKVVWYKNEERITAEKLQNQIIRKANCSFLNITNVVHNDTGDYVCKVTQDIPKLAEYTGEKTVLIIAEVQPSTTQTTTQGIISISMSKKPDVSEEDKNKLDPRKRNGSSRDVIIFIFRSLPFICLLLAFIYLNRDDKPITRSKPVERAGDSGGADEDLEATEKRRKDTEEVKQNESVCEEQEGRIEPVKPEKPDVAAETEEKETESLVNAEKGRPTPPINEHENEIISAPNTEENTHLMEDVDEQSVSVLEQIITAL